MLRRYGSTVCVVLVLVLSTTCICASDKKADVDIWRAMKDYSIGSVAWSPEGDAIAFVAGRWKDEVDAGLSRDSIWLLSLSKDRTAGTKLRQLLTLSRKGDAEGIASSLFWLNGSTLGWATQGGGKYTFMQMGLGDAKPTRLVKESFTGTACTDCMGGDTPGDVYYDAGSKTLLFSAITWDCKAYVKILPLSTGKVRTLSVQHPAALTYPDGYLDWVTVCSSLRDPEKPVFYLSAAATVLDREHTGDGWYLWRSDSEALRQDKMIVRPDDATFRPMFYPRISPKGGSLAFVRYLHESVGSGPREIAVCDLVSGRTTTVAKPVSSEDSPTYGCPYSWSPDGKQIAHADGPRIKIIQVDPRSVKTAK